MDTISKKLPLFVLISITLCIGAANAAGLKNFADETREISNIIKCPDSKIMKTEGLPDLWGCIFPGADAVKVFVNASDDNASVSNVKIMWNDWTQDTGYGVHIDKEIAEAWVSALATKYAPEKVAEVLDAFRGKTDTVIEGDGVHVKYTYFKGPAIDERLITITP
ncbi:hypothetical protein [Phyllobacterium leguminum]|uniref:Uncharacterized protein n=1 Tax=Phyllobacterium leguminum TaxID=314237 RepID=A0A318T187_9HYPH|nr:hypothetical protein [Phyllobacterium leguminum]PYE87456.1 hypothetical protein C7477_11378 [Phyllobacterium leguminum]